MSAKKDRLLMCLQTGSVYLDLENRRVRSSISIGPSGFGWFPGALGTLGACSTTAQVALDPVPLRTLLGL